MPSFAEAVRLWLKIGLLSFGGPAGQIATMHRLLVDEKKWLDEPRFLHALNFCMLLPGPEAQQLATYAGWLLHGVKGGVAAGVLFILPGFLVMMALSALYVGLHHLPLVDGAFFGLKAAVLAVVAEALLRISRRALTHPAKWALAGAAFLALILLNLPFPLVVLAAGAAGAIAVRLRPAAAAPQVTKPPRRPFAWGTVLACLVLWALPVAAALAWGGGAFGQLGLFFSKMAVVTFGGAYAVLSYVAQQAVGVHGWLTAEDMLAGLGLAETTPGPLILVNQFVGFLAGFHQPGPLPPWGGGVLGAVLTVWVTFLPSFLWIFAGAPYVEALRGNRTLAGALAAITAAVVGVILNLAVWFAWHVLMADGTPNWPGLAIAAAAALMLLRLHWGMGWTLALCAAIGMGWAQLAG